MVRFCRLGRFLLASYSLPLTLKKVPLPLRAAHFPLAPSASHKLQGRFPFASFALDRLGDLPGEAVELVGAEGDGALAAHVDAPSPPSEPVPCPVSALKGADNGTP